MMADDALQFTYAITVGPVAYSIVAEISAVRLRAQTVVLARNAYQIVNIVSQILVPHQLNAESWNWQGKTGVSVLVPGETTVTNALLPVLLGRHLRRRRHLGLLPPAGAEGPHLRGTRHLVRAGSQCAQICEG